MLKFADLSIDMKSYENSLDSFMKLFPGSYIPLLIVFLSHQGKILVESNLDVKDPRTIFSINTNDIFDFIGIDRQSLKGKNAELAVPSIIKEFTELMNSEHDNIMLYAFFKSILGILNTKTISLIVNANETEEIIEIKNRILRYEPDIQEKAAFWFLCNMMIAKFSPTGDCKDDSSDLTPNEELVNESSSSVGMSPAYFIEDFEYTLNKIMSYAGDKSWIQPHELTMLVLSQRKDGAIYNPFAGLASYSIALEEELGVPHSYHPARNIGNDYYGEEIDEITWAIGKLRLMAHSCDSKNYRLQDSTKRCHGQIKNVISTPPFNFLITNENGEQEFADHFVIRRGMEMISEDGLLACVVPFSFFFRKDTEDIKKVMVDRGWLESVVYLPINLFNNTSINTAIIFIRKTKHHYVNFVDGTTSVKISGKKNILDEEIVANLLEHNSYPQGFTYDSMDAMNSKLPENVFKKLRNQYSYDFIKKNNYDLSPKEYFSDIVTADDGFKLVKLKNFVSVICSPAENNAVGIVIKPDMLSGDIYVPLTLENVDMELYGNEFNIISSDALLVAASHSLRPTQFKYTNGYVVYNKNRIHALHVKADRILPDYLLLELGKDYVMEQLRHKYSGSAMRVLAIDDLLSIYIQVPENTQQALKIEQKIVEERKLIHFASVGKELSVLKDKQHEDYVKMLRQRKHRIQQVMNEFAPAFALLNRYRAKNGGTLHDTDIVASRTGETVDDYFSKMGNIVSKVEELVTNLVDKDQWAEKSIIDIDKFVSEIPNTHVSDKYDFQIISDTTYSDVDLFSDQFNRNIEINKDDLETIFDNIIANAVKWGFTDSKRKDYRIRIEVSDSLAFDLPYVTIRISNNGERIHSSVDRSRFFEWGYGSGSGIGTWQLENIVNHYAGILQLHEYPGILSGFETEYEILLPLKNDD